MKTRELIQLLQDSDPTGDCEVVCHGTSVDSVCRSPGYYDGSYDIVTYEHAERTTRGEKVVIFTRTIEDALYSDEDLPVSYTCGCADDRGRRESFMAWVEATRADVRKMRDDLELGLFIDWAKHQRQLNAEAAERLFRERYPISYKTPLPDDLRDLYAGSYRDRRYQQWTRECTT